MLSVEFLDPDSDRTRIKSYLGRFQRYRRGRICFVRAVRRFFDAARPRLAGLARQYPDASSPVLADLSKLFARERARIFTDIVHYNARGNRLLAEALYGKIRDVIPETVNGRSGR